MSCDYRVVTMRTDVCQKEKIALKDVFGQFALPVLAEVLDSDWAREQGWSTVQQGRVYRCAIVAGVNLEIHIDQQGDAWMQTCTAAEYQVTTSAHGTRLSGKSPAAVELELHDRLARPEIRNAAGVKAYQLVNRVYEVGLRQKDQNGKSILGDGNYTIVGEPIVVTDDQRRRIRVEVKLRATNRA